MAVAQGAREAILGIVDPGKKTAKEFEAKIDELSRDGLRVLGVARTDERGKWRYLGLRNHRARFGGGGQGAKEQGIDTRMVTEAHLTMARPVSKQLELGQVIKIAPEVFSPGKEANDPAGVQQKSR
jgi:H+-transporting ATPase